MSEELGILIETAWKKSDERDALREQLISVNNDYAYLQKQFKIAVDALKRLSDWDFDSTWSWDEITEHALAEIEMLNHHA